MHGRGVGRALVMIVAPIAALCVAITLADLLFRLLFTVTDVPLNVSEPVIGYMRAPDQRGRYLSGDAVRGAFDINAQGWNHPGNYRLAKDSGVARVALIGDSQVEALEVQPGERMSAVAERAMSTNGRRVEWLPFGTSGYGTSQELDVLRRYALAYHPDVAILLFVQNDPFDTSPYLSELEPFVTKYALGNEALIRTAPTTTWSAGAMRRLAMKSAIVRYFFAQRRLADRIATGRRGVRNAGPFPLRARPRRNTTRDDERQTWALIAKLLQAARDESARAGVTFAVAFRGAPGAIDSAMTQPAALAAAESDPFCLGARFEAMGPQCLEPIVRSLGIPYIDLTAPLQAAVTRTHESHHFADDIHYKAPAHAVAGQALAAFVDSLLPLRRSSPSRSPHALHSIGPEGSPPRH